jgi:hypothetical protein
VLGNKCAGRHNFKTVYFIETLVLGYFFGMVISNMCVFCSARFTMVDAQDGNGELFCSNGGGDTLQALLEGALGQKALCQQ